MKYILTKGGHGYFAGISPEKDDGKLCLSFSGETAESVSIGGKFHPIRGGVAEVPTAGLSGKLAFAAHNLTAGKRYVCDELFITEDGGGRMIFCSCSADAAKVAASVDELLAERTDLKKRLEKLEEATFGLKLF